MTFYSYGLTIEQQPGSLSHSKSLAATSSDSATASTRKGANTLQLGVAAIQFIGPGGGVGDIFSPDFSPDFGGSGSSPGYILVSVGKLANASNASAYAAVQMKFTSHFPVLQVASAQIASLFLPLRASRGLFIASGEAVALSFANPYHAVVAAKQPAAAQLRRLISRSLLRVSSQAAAVMRGVGRGLTATSPQTQVSGLARGPGRVLGVPEASVALALKSIGRIFAAIHQREVSAVPRVPGRVLRAASASVAKVVRGFPYHVSGVASAAAVLLSFGGGNLFTRVFSAASSGSPLLVRGISASRSAVGAQSATVMKTLGRLLAAGDASAAIVLKAAGRQLGIASTSVLGAAVRLPRLVRGVASGSVLTALHPRLVASLVAFVVSQTETVAAATQRVLGRSLVIPHTQTATLSISAVVSHLRTLVVLQVQAVASATPRTLFRLFMVAYGAAQASFKAVGFPLSAATPQIYGLLTTTLHSLMLAVAGTAFAFLRVSHSLTRGVGSIEVASVIPLHLRNAVLGALTGSITALRNGLTHLVAIVSPQSSGLIQAIRKIIPATQASAVALIRLFFRFPAAASSQAASLIARHGSTIGGVVTANAAAIRRRTGKLVGSVLQQVAAAGRIEFKIIGAAMSSAAMMLRPRGLKLGAIQSQIGSTVRWFHLFVADWAAQQTVLLPPGGGPAEPPDFGPIDPLDQTTFAFNWSSRADPNDPIVSATVISVPPGLTFAQSPVFITGTLVEVTVVPSTPPLFPAVYKLRCSAVFASGRRSSFSIPVPVRTL